MSSRCETVCSHKSQQFLFINWLLFAYTRESKYNNFYIISLWLPLNFLFGKRADQELNTRGKPSTWPVWSNFTSTVDTQLDYNTAKAWLSGYNLCMQQNLITIDTMHSWRLYSVLSYVETSNCNDQPLTLKNWRHRALAIIYYIHAYTNYSCGITHGCSSC